MFCVHPVSSPFSLKSEFYLPFLFCPPAVTFIHLKVKKQIEDNSDRLVNPRTLSSRLIQGTHPLKLL